ncbi:unnamed protein product [Acanthoscelides obtectus]|uniref:Uncharacterized protein n=1 Tax=Acanthoscelides obtectus TaxID=200917 RepID=A0A9P0L0I8_ACAOB|nr:unnamed protein product [Acanthoscelides obtectus]CAK1651218.1 hypothetical protein AOBTE_LOCUS17122 [Acanthoscelides obtectus]
MKKLAFQSLNQSSARVFCIVLETEISFFKYREEISFYVVNLFCTVLSTGGNFGSHSGRRR